MSFWGKTSPLELRPLQLRPLHIRPLHIRLWDADTVQLSNLHRQILFTTDDVGRPKAAALAERLAAVAPNPAVTIEARTERLERANIEALGESSLIIDATDSVETKFLLNDFSVERGIPFCYGGAVSFHGQLLFTAPQNAACGCLRCLFADFPPEDMAELGPTCRGAGILGPIVGHIGFLQGELAASFLAGTLDLSAGSVFYRFDLRDGRAHRTSIRKNSDCTIHTLNKARTLDLTGKVCPSTFLYTKLALEQLRPGEHLAVRYSSRESAFNVSASVLEEGHAISESPREEAPGVWTLTIVPRKHG